MLLTFVPLLVYLFFLVYAVSAAATTDKRFFTRDAVCTRIYESVTTRTYFAEGISVNYIGATQYYMTSSSDRPRCVVEVADSNEISKVLKIVAESKTPFAVKSGGHSSNPGFSSTKGVLISLIKINHVRLSEAGDSVEIGMGNRWTDVYKALDGKGVQVVGGRVPGPGTGGFSLGGGFSWLTNQYGLTVDTVISYNLILPNGTITTIDDSNPDLFFALKGGLNRFGVVSSMILKTVPQSHKVYGGIIFFDRSVMPQLIKATEEFQTQNTDPKAQVILTMYGGLLTSPMLIAFYDGPNRPAAFDRFLEIPKVLSALKTQSYLSFVNSIPALLAGGSRGAFHTFSTTSLTQGFMNAIYNETTFYERKALLKGGLTVSYDIEPFTKYGAFATDSAFPHENSPLPLNLFFSWIAEKDDTYWRGVMQTSVDYLKEVAKKEGIFKEDMYAYPNYALGHLTGDQLYGATNAARLRDIQAQVDPENVMSLAGGFRI